jgi:selenocysteine lyase/cysteine desulfurase
MERYEGGTPNVAGIIRVGLTFLMKRKAQEKYARLVAENSSSNNSSSSNGLCIAPIPPRSIEEYDYQTHEHVSRFLKEQAPNLVLLGSNDDGGQNKLPIFSFLIRWGKRFLHYNYVCAVLNDVFGIQSRGGCQCSGPYSQRILGLTDINDDGDEVPNQRNMEIETALVNFKERAELLRPGYTRISLPFKGLMEEEVEYVKKALVWVAEHAWELMCQYRCNHRTGEVSR